MKKKIVRLISFFLALPTAVFAENLKTVDNNKTLEGVIVGGINFLLVFIIALAALFIVIGGVQYITSGGNQEKADIAKKTITYAIIGLAAAVASLVIIKFVNKTVTGFLS